MPAPFPDNMPFRFIALALALLLAPALSFLAYRIIRRRSEGLAPWGGLSRCHRCGRPVRPLPGRRGLLARFSGRKSCGHPPDPLIAWSGAIITGGFIALTLTHPDQSWLAWSQALLLLFLVYPLAAIDWMTMTVEIRLVALGMTLRIGALLLFDRAALAGMAAGLLLGAGFFHILDLFYEVVRKRRGLGEGDAAVAGLVGAFVGWQGLPATITLAATAGLVGGTIELLATRRSLASPFPFAPFLGGAGLVVHLAQLHGWAVANGVWPIVP